MTKAELIDELFARTGITRARLLRVLANYPAPMLNALARGDEVRWFNFGTFKKGGRAARHWNNPRNGTHPLIRSRSVLVFRPHIFLLESVNPP